MTKAELIKAMESMPDDSEVFIQHDGKFYSINNMEPYGDNSILPTAELVGC